MANTPVHHDDPSFAAAIAREKRQAARKRWLALIAIVACVVALIFGFRPLGRAIKTWQSRRLAGQAEKLIEQKRWDEAAKKARDAVQLRPGQPDAWRPVARLLADSGQAQGSLEWWKKLDDVGKLTLDDRRRYAAAALAAGELQIASAQIDLLLGQDGGTAAKDNLLAAQLAARHRDGPRALDYAERVMNDADAEPTDRLAAARLVLSFTKSDSPPYARAWSQIARLADDVASPASLPALVTLAERAVPAPTVDLGTGESVTLSMMRDPSAIAPGAEQPKSLPLDQLAQKLDSHPDATPYHHLLALELRAREDPEHLDRYVADAIDQFRNGDDETVAALLSWLHSQKRDERVLEILPLDRALKQKRFFLQYLDALSGLGRWNEIKDLLNGEQFPLDELFQHMQLARIRTQLGEQAGAANEWQRALEVADNPVQLMDLGNFAAGNHVYDVADTAFTRAIAAEPRLRAAYAARLQIARATGDTKKAQAIAAEVVKLWPDDSAARNDEAYLRLLLGATGGDAEGIARDAEALVLREPGNWNARATLGLARLRLNRPEAALEAFRGVRAVGSEPPGAIAVRTAVFAANGYIDDAKSDARNLAAFNLFPEERALIAPLL